MKKKKNFILPTTKQIIRCYKKTKIQFTYKSFVTMRFLDKLIPNILRSLDKRYLLHNPFMWVTKLHYILFYGIVWTLICSIISFIIPVNFSSIPNPIIYFTFLLIPPLLGLVLWIYKQILFNIENNFGKVFKGIEWARWGVYATIIFFIFLGPLISYQTFRSKVENLCSIDDLEKDVELLNQSNIFFPTDKYNDNFKQNYREYLAPKKHTIENNYDDSFFDLGYYYDRSEQVSDTGYDENSIDPRFSLIKRKDESLKHIATFIKISKKYGFEINHTPKEIYTNFIDINATSENFTITRDKKYALQGHIKSIKDIQKSYSITTDKNGTYEVTSIFTIGAFCLLLLLVVGKSSTLRNLIISLLCFILLGFIIGIFTAISHQLLGFGDENFLLVLGVVVYGGLFLSLTNISKSSAKYSLSKAIRLNIVHLATPFITIWTCGLLDEINIIDLSGKEALIVTHIGFIVYLVIFLPYLKKLHRKLKAMPKP